MILIKKTGSILFSLIVISLILYHVYQLSKLMTLVYDDLIKGV